MQRVGVPILWKKKHTAKKYPQKKSFKKVLTI